MKVSLLAILFLFLTPEWDHMQTIKVSARILETDNLGHVYTVVGDGRLVKYNTEGQLLFDFDIKDLGAITSVDVRNPMKILVWFEEFTTLVTLDRTLSETGRVNLLDINIPRAQFIARSFDDQYWVFDEQTLRLKKINDALEVSVVSDIFSSFLYVQDVRPNFIIERSNQVFVNDPNIGIMVFDIYGTYAKTIAKKGLTSFQVKGDFISYLSEGHIVYYHMLTFAEDVVTIPEHVTKEGEVLAHRQEEGVAYLLLKNQVDLYRL